MIVKNYIRFSAIRWCCIYLLPMPILTHNFYVSSYSDIAVFLFRQNADPCVELISSKPVIILPAIKILWGSQRLMIIGYIYGRLSYHSISMFVG